MLKYYQIPTCFYLQERKKNVPLFAVTDLLIKR